MWGHWGYIYIYIYIYIYRILTDNVASSVGQGRKRAYAHNIRYPKVSEKSLALYKIIPLQFLLEETLKADQEIPTVL